MRASVDRPRTYLLLRRDRSRHRLGGDQHRRRPDPQPVRQPRGGGIGLDHRGAEHPAACSIRSSPGSTRSRSTLGGLRITPLVILKTTVLLVLLIWAAIAASNFLDKQLRGFPDLTPSIQVLLEQADPHRAADVRDHHRAELGRHRPLGAGGVHRRGRRRPRLRPAEDRLQPGQRHHSAGRQVDQAGRRDLGRRPVRLGRPRWARATPRSTPATAAST